MAESMLSLRKMQAVSWIILAVLVCGSAIFASVSFALSTCIGGVISICSFWVSNRDVVHLVDSVSSLASLEDRQARAQQGQKGYLLKFWLRIVIIGVVLFLLIKSGQVNIFGLILGLSTVVFAVTFISLNAAGHYFFRGRR